MKKPSGFTLIELLVVIAIIALLVSILMPSLQKAKELAKDVVCSSNQKNLGTATHLYGQEFDDFLPYNTMYMPGYWNLSWAKRIGKMPAGEMPEVLKFRPFHSDFVIPGKPVYEICSNGYVEFNWHLYSGGMFKCPTYWDQWEPKNKGQGGQDYPSPLLGQYPFGFDTQGLQFSQNGLFTKGGLITSGNEPKIDPEGKFWIKRFGDIRKGRTVMLGDCAMMHGGGTPMPDRVHISNTSPSDTIAQVQDKLESRGPWMWITSVYIGSMTAPVDNMPGHSGEKSQLTFMDGHVEGVATLRGGLWLLD